MQHRPVFNSLKAKSHAATKANISTPTASTEEFASSLDVKTLSAASATLSSSSN